MADAGWYPDPQDANAEQYWDGARWTGQRRGAGGAAMSAEAQDVRTDAQETRVNPIFQGYVAQEPQQGYPQGGYPQQGQPWPGQQPPAKRRRGLLISAGVVVVLVAAGLITWLAWPGTDAPKITYRGQALRNASATLTTAETAVSKTVTSRHGVTNDQTRCYFVQAEKPAQGTKKSDVQDSLSCGPVLFVDGNTASQYLPVTVTAQSRSGRTDLMPTQSLDNVDPTSLRAGFTLVRPDGKTAPEGSGGLTVPAPPATQQDSVTVADLGSTPAPPSLPSASMTGRTRKVTLVSAGYVTRYGTGTDARSAPRGQRLLAFTITSGAGDLSSGTGAEIALLVDGATRSLPTATSGQYIVASVGTSASVALQLSDSGDTQSLSLPAGAPGGSNIQVLARQHRTALIGTSFSVPITLTKGSRSASTTFKAMATLASLDYWPPVNESIKPSGPGKAFLSVRLNYTSTAEPGKTFGFDPALLRLRLADGSYVRARNIAPSGKVADVFEVPADFTSGTIQIAGSEKVSGGVTVRVAKTKQLAIRITAG